jgi:hypothetical protein
MPQFESLVRLTEKRVPPASKRVKRSVDSFLAYFEHRVLASLDAARQLTLIQPGPSTPGQVLYFEHQAQTIKWLRNMNASRRERDNDSKSG